MNILEQKRNEYKEYIDEHISNVWKAWKQVTEIFKDEEFVTDIDINKTITKNILNHDISKYSFEEFEPYRMRFFSIIEDEKDNNSKVFDEAWKHHYTYNQHHWNYWVRSDDIVVAMDLIYIIEMICDWIAMGYKFKNTAYDYYYKNKDNIKLHDDTRLIVEKYLDQLK